MLFGIGGARQDQVGAGRALVAMMADIDLERAAKLAAGTSSAPSRSTSSGLAFSMSAMPPFWA